ncbi:MAG: family 16 glycoside hydrolase, partial [Planctomycetota bacterium]
DARALALAFGDESSAPALLALLADSSAPQERRAEALDALTRVRYAPAAATARALLGEPALRGPALRALAEFEDEATPAAVLAVYGELTPDERRDAQATLASRPAWARPLLDAIAAGSVPRSEVGAFVIRQLRAHGDDELDALVRDAWGNVRDTPEEKRERIAELRARLTPEALTAADLPRGRALFARTCQQCHTLFDRGGDLGPDLTGSNRGDLDYLLHTAIDPSAEVGRDYQATVVWLLDGRVVTGLLSEETDSALVLRTETDTIVVPRDEIDEVRPSDLSTMPDGLLDGLADDEVRDLVAYLASPAQVPRLLLPGDEAELFDGATLAGWRGDAAVWSVEDGAIVGASTGLARNAFLRSDAHLRDFRLRLEVRLAGDAGNSGIQFRSRELSGGDVAGYQADIGPGWWGKLYDEHGRGVLDDTGGAAHVRRGEWNDYEILAVGHRIVLRINGEVSADYDDPDGALGGILALQVHSGGATDVRFRNLRLELDPELPDDLDR